MCRFKSQSNYYNYPTIKYWAQSFMKRNSDLSLRRPEATSIGMVQCFNTTAVNNFFNNWIDVLDLSILLIIFIICIRRLIF